ncbi:N-acetylgalactosaminyltransferase 7-like isoform X2 [Glandiceps talaboti]
MMRLRAKFFVKAVAGLILLCLGTIALFIRLDTLDEHDKEAARKAVLGARHGQKPINSKVRQNLPEQKGKGKPNTVIGLPPVEGIEVDLKKRRKERGRDDVNVNQNGEQDKNLRFGAGHEPKRRVYPAVMRKEKGNFEPLDILERSGPGEYGVPVNLERGEQSLYDQSVKEYGFNMVISDRISLDRAVPDIRHEQCQFWEYPEDLPTVSVVVVFHNEGWTTLMRTVHSVFNTSPPQLLAEIVMVDDFSDKKHLKEKLESYITHPRFEGKIKLVRNAKREGLIRARTIGGENALRGEVLLFLDAHCECNKNWLPPLLTRIALNRTTVVCPTVDSIDADTFAYAPQPDGICRGSFDWEFFYKRIPIGEREAKRRKFESEPYPSPVMAGGLFAIDRSYFFELGGYDPGLQIWGGEQYEISFKIWMCGGTLEFVPCSRVAHIYRKLVPYSYPSNNEGSISVVHQNHLRVVEVWLDDYKKYFYASQPGLIGKYRGDISAQVEFRKKKCPKSFQWFMDEVAYDLIENYPLPAPNKYWGEVKSVGTVMCLDTMGRKNNARVGISGCHGMGGNQLFRFNEAGQFIIYDQCLFVSHFTLKLDKCKKGIKYNWEYNEHTKMIMETSLNLCVELDPMRQDIVMETCDTTKKLQEWEITQNY